MSCTVRNSRDYKEIKELEFFLGIKIKVEIKIEINMQIGKSYTGAQ